MLLTGVKPVSKEYVSPGLSPILNPALDEREQRIRLARAAATVFGIVSVL